MGRQSPPDETDTLRPPPGRARPPVSPKAPPSTQGSEKHAGARADDEIPLDIYGSLVDALFEVQTSLFVGSAAASIAAIVTAWKAESPLLFGFGIVIALVAYLRALDMRAYRRIRPSFQTADAFRYWERRYVVGAAIYVGLLGGWCLAAFVVSDDPFVRLFSFSVVLAYMIGTSGRNFASRSLVMSQILGAGIPLTAALFYVGGLHYVMFGIVVMPFFLGLKLISERLRGTLLSAVISEREVRDLADHFDTALNNMPHGLCMFDERKRVRVANRRLSALLELPADMELTGRNAHELLRDSAVLRQARDLDIVEFIQEFEHRLSGASVEFYSEIEGERSLSFTTEPMANGGSVVVVEDITERRNAEQRIRQLARFDALTGLPNRNVFHEELQDALVDTETGLSLSVLFIDLDQFKQVNDTLGHPTGDLLLCAVADRLRSALSADERVARFGGDEFAVLQLKSGQNASPAELAERIVQSISRPYHIQNHTVIIGASIGIATSPKDGTDADVLLKNADLALYHAKGTGPQRWRFFEPAMDIAVQARRALELDLRQALEKDGFELYYQPLLNIRSMKIVGCEALLRWNHPQRGMIPPAEFIPVAEEMGLIVEIGDWVLNRACVECRKWPEDVRISVNLSSVQFKRSDVASTVAAALRSSGLAPERLELEITESVLLQDMEQARRTLQQLRDIGVRIALDDFGTGYSGLSYLHAFPLDTVKIDRSFVNEIDTQSRSLILLRGVAELSKALGMKVTVEGIETSEQLDIVAAETAVDEVQGFLFSVPLPARAIRELIVSARPAAGTAAALQGTTRH